jgi:hypothetical protein
MTVPQAGQKKKGLHWLVWVAIGCGGLVIISGVGIAVGMYFLAQKAKSFVEEAAKDPVLAAAKAYALVNPEVEIVSTDENARTVTFRNTKTGEEATFDYEDIERGEITFESDGQSVELKAGGEDAPFTVTTQDGSATIGGDASGIPIWVPKYPGAKIQPGFAVNTQEERSGLFSLETTDPVGDVLEFYRRELEGAGMNPELTKTESGESGTVVAGMVVGRTADEKRTVTATISGSAVAVSYTEKP